jgi:glycosyltransferase involved in cell wall biosynthesis
MKILILNYEFPPLGGGASPVSYEIAKRFSERGYVVDVVTMSYKGLKKTEKVNENLTVYRVPSWRSKKEICHPWEQLTYLFTGFFQCRKLIKKSQYYTCHCHFLIPTGILACVLKKIYGLEYILTAHGSDVPGFNNDRFKVLHKFTRPFLRCVIKNSQKTISPSKYLKELILSKIDDKINNKVALIPNGINISNFKPKNKEKIIFSTGRLLKRKGFHYLIKAVSNEDLGFEVHIAGDGPMRNHLEELAKESKTKIVFHGWIDNTGKEFKNLIEKSSIFVLASLKENASISLLEGMSAGCAMVTTNISGCPETVGEAGKIAEAGNVEDLREKVEELTNDREELQKFQKMARKRVEEVFDWEKVINKYVSETGL